MTELAGTSLDTVLFRANHHIVANRDIRQYNRFGALKTLLPIVTLPALV